MAPHIVELHDAREAFDRARAFLIAEPAHHNLLLTILESSIEFSLGGSFWLVVDGTEVVGFGLESPPGMGAVLAPMPPSISRGNRPWRAMNHDQAEAAGGAPTGGGSGKAGGEPWLL